MPLSSRREILAGIAGLSVAASTGLCWAQNYPSRLIKLVVPYPPGGPADVIGRIAAQRIAELGQSVVVENKSGASGSIGAASVAQAPADGYTLLLGNIAINAINPHAFKSISYDAMKDFTPICCLAVPLITVSVHPSVSARNIAELVAYAKEKPNSLSFASSGFGSPHHLAGELLCKMAGIKMTHVPYRGAAPAVTDVVGGQCPVGFISLQTALPFHRDGRLRVLAMTESVRATMVPDIPTVSETLSGFEMTNWQALYGPAGLPFSICNLIYSECVTALTESKDKMETQGLALLLQSPDEFASFSISEFARWKQFILTNNITQG